LSDMEDLFSNFFSSRNSHSENRFLPAMNISSNDESVSVSIELPGVNVEDVDINIDKNILTISGEKKSIQDESKDSYHRIESICGKFSRSVRIPDEADSEQVTASFKNGLLNVEIKKSEAKKPKSIPIEN